MHTFLKPVLMYIIYIPVHPVYFYYSLCILLLLRWLPQYFITYIIFIMSLLTQTLEREPEIKEFHWQWQQLGETAGECTCNAGNRHCSRKDNYREKEMCRNVIITEKDDHLNLCYKTSRADGIQRRQPEGTCCGSQAKSPGKDCILTYWTHWHLSLNSGSV